MPPKSVKASKKPKSGGRPDVDSTTSEPQPSINEIDKIREENEENEKNEIVNYIYEGFIKRLIIRCIGRELNDYESTLIKAYLRLLFVDYINDMFKPDEVRNSVLHSIEDISREITGYVRTLKPNEMRHNGLRGAGKSIKILDKKSGGIPSTPEFDNTLEDLIYESLINPLINMCGTTPYNNKDAVMKKLKSLMDYIYKILRKREGSSFKKLLETVARSSYQIGNLIEEHDNVSLERPLRRQEGGKHRKASKKPKSGGSTLRQPEPLSSPEREQHNIFVIADLLYDELILKIIDLLRKIPDETGDIKTELELIVKNIEYLIKPNPDSILTDIQIVDRIKFECANIIDYLRRLEGVDLDLDLDRRLDDLRRREGGSSRKKSLGNKKGGTDKPENPENPIIAYLNKRKNPSDPSDPRLTRGPIGPIDNEKKIEGFNRPRPLGPLVIDPTKRLDNRKYQENPLLKTIDPVKDKLRGISGNK